MAYWRSIGFIINQEYLAGLSDSGCHIAAVRDGDILLFKLSSLLLPRV